MMNYLSYIRDNIFWIRLQRAQLAARLALLDPTLHRTEDATLTLADD